MTDLPIACSLTAEQIPARRAALVELVEHALLDARVTGRVVVRRDARSEAALDRFVQAERECCPFFDLEVTTYSDTLVLEIGGPAEAEPMIAALVETFRSPHDAELAL
jgi:hypothetical protein